VTSGRWIDRGWLFACVVASSLWCVTAASRLSATFDEPFYVRAGLEFWRTGSHGTLLRKGTMPFAIDAQTLPLSAWERVRGRPFDGHDDLGQILPWARAMTLPFWWLLLGYGWRIGRSVAGPWGGRLAVAMLACEPSLLAHAGLATTDVAVAACVVALVYHFRAGRGAGWGWRVGVPMLWYGAALVAKASALLLGPLCLAVVALAGGADDGGSDRSVGSHHSPVRDLATIVAGGLALAFVYCGSDWRAEASFVRWAHGLPDAPLASALRWVSEHLRIFSNAGEALVRQIGHNMRGHGAFLLGRTAPRAFWYYFPVLTTIKLSEPLLLAPAALVLLRPRSLLNWPFLVALVLVAFSVTFRVQLGVRMILPAVAFLVIGVASAAVRAARTTGPVGRAVIVGGSVAAVLWTVATAGSVWPHGLVYVNRFWGGPADGYRLVSDSNYDWGQGLPELAEWAAQRAPAGVGVWYFGTDPAVARAPLREVPLHRLPLTTVSDVVNALRGQCLAVSTTILYGSEPRIDAYRVAARFLRTQAPVARTTTFLIYDFGEGAAACPGAGPMSLTRITKNSESTDEHR